MEAYVEIIPTSHTLHPAENSICAIYIRPLNDTKGYIIPINHSEAINFPIEEGEKVLNSIKNIHIRDKKEFLHYIQQIEWYSLLQPTPSLTTYIPELTAAHKHLYQKNHKEPHLNIMVPIVKHYEVCTANYNNFTFRKTNIFYNNRATIVFNMLEQTGIKVDNTLFKQYFNRDANGYVHTKYNLNTTTTRPSNTFGGVNFSALNKENGERQCFIPRNHKFIEMDISAYHPTLLANLLDYDFGGVDIHNAFAEMYGVEYSKAKEITFKQIYGGIWKDYENLPFFQKVKVYTNELWQEFQSKGYIECPISGYKFEGDKLDNMNPQKLLNYLLQNLETATNILILWDIFKILRGKNTKLVLYVYDSFLLDFDEGEEEILEEIKGVFDKNKLQTKTKTGVNYNFS
tara:strand:+ start:70 stop:1272 length:1203 start_codon:yes stop_codon:yes gene_type:complete